MRCILILFRYTPCSYDDGFHVFFSRRYDTNLDICAQQCCDFVLLFYLLLYYAVMGWMIFYGQAHGR